MLACWSANSPEKRGRRAGRQKNTAEAGDASQCGPHFHGSKVGEKRGDPLTKDICQLSPQAHFPEASNRMLYRSSACPVTEQKLLCSMEQIHRGAQSRSEISSRGNTASSGPARPVASEGATCESSEKLIHRKSFRLEYHSLLDQLGWTIEVHHLEVGRRLGEGGFGEAFEGKHHGSSVCIKVLGVNAERAIRRAVSAYGQTHGLCHSRLVSSYGACAKRGQILLVTELMEGDLFHALATNRRSSPKSIQYFARGWRIALDIASALVYLHSKDAVHLDIKPSNILLDGSKRAKLADLGLARILPDGRLNLAYTIPGSPAYSAPEVIEAQLRWRLKKIGRSSKPRSKVGKPADIFAFGAVLYEICLGKLSKGWRQNLTTKLSEDQAPVEVAQLIDACLSYDSERRPTAEEVYHILRANEPW